MAKTISCDLSIIIVSWNCRDFLFGCLESIYGKKKPFSYEIIVVDNASTDDSTEFVQKHFPGVHLIKNNENLGFAKANNIGITASEGRYVCLINSDVIVLDGCLDTLISFMENNQSVGAAGPKVYYPDMSLQCTCRRFPSLWNSFCFAIGLNRVFKKSSFFSSEQMFYFTHDQLIPVDVIAGCFMIIRRETINQVGLLDEHFFFYAEDIDWCKRCWKANWQIHFVPSANAIHYGGGSSSNAPTRFIIEQQRANVQYWKKHHSRFAVSIFLFILGLSHGFRLFLGSISYIFLPSGKVHKIQQLSKYYARLKYILFAK